MRRFLLASLAGSVFAIGLSAPPARAAMRERPCRNGYVSISFDDGPTASTPALLKALKRADMQATFFDIGEHAAELPDYVKAERAGGHAIGNHTYTHPDLTTLTSDQIRAELKKTQRVLEQLTGGRATNWMRPPYGAINDTVRVVADDLDLKPIIWTTDTNDWDGRDTQSIVDAALTVRPGGFVLMHDGYPNTIAAVPQIAAGLAARGLCDGRIVSSKTPTQAWEGLSFNATVAAW